MNRSISTICSLALLLGSTMFSFAEEPTQYLYSFGHPGVAPQFVESPAPAPLTPAEAPPTALVPDEESTQYLYTFGRPGIDPNFPPSDLTTAPATVPMEHDDTERSDIRISTHDNEYLDPDNVWGVNHF